jgi:hypothetical protein
VLLAHFIEEIEPSEEGSSGSKPGALSSLTILFKYNLLDKVKLPLIRKAQ